MKEEYYKEDGQPIKCFSCGSTNIEEKIVSSINYTACEVRYDCGDCGEDVGYWAYGYFDPQYAKYFAEGGE